MVQSVLMWYIGQGELRSLKYGAKRPQMVHWARWANKFKYGAKSPQVVHWAMWAKKFKIWCKASPGGTLGNVS